MKGGKRNGAGRKPCTDKKIKLWIVKDQQKTKKQTNGKYGTLLMKKMAKGIMNFTNFLSIRTLLSFGK